MSNVSAAGISRFLTRCGFVNRRDFRTEQSRFDRRPAVCVICGDSELFRKYLEGNGYHTEVHRSTGELFVTHKINVRG